ncbi:immunoglobulin superfamily member 3-like [Bufo bufo]|uniref:immunoglobulin superfamily member 3-like n=1 Tax=Bufo bufo TaxID=8384 RepID=UPI001ABE0822|nr:immunoglobulin superfamily member 3-like [Bufo bufo]
MYLTPHSTALQCLLTAALLLYTGGVLSQVQVPQGPLFRVQGSAVALWCNATGYPARGFEWSIHPAQSPRQRLQIVSSVDPDFSYAIYRERLNVRREIYLEKVRKDSARLHLVHIQATDAGDYECYAPSLRHDYYGSHSASVRLSVIPDLLQVSLLSPEELTLHAESSVTLTCEVVSGTAQHTHISITWYQSRLEADRPIATCSEQSVMSVAAAFQDRHWASELRLEKVSATRYQLSLSALRGTDDGHYYCQATEWIQDPDRSWYPLSSKRSRGTAVHVHAADVMSAVHSSTADGTHPKVFYILMLQLPLVAWAAY